MVNFEHLKFWWSHKCDSFNRLPYDFEGNLAPKAALSFYDGLVDRVFASSKQQPKALWLILNVCARFLAALYVFPVLCAVLVELMTVLFGLVGFLVALPLYLVGVFLLTILEHFFQEVLEKANENWQNSLVENP